MGNNNSETDTADSIKKIEAIIRAVAVKHGIALGRDDPILILHTLNELLISEFAKKQEELIQQFQICLEADADQSSKNADKKAAEILMMMKNSHSQLMTEFIENQIPVIASSILNKFNDATEPQQRRTSQHIKSINGQLKLMKRLVYLNIASSIMFLVIGVSIFFLVLTSN